ncbi:hypothetical protein [Nocardioides nanhaiensis]|uniref:Glycoside hydrolase family 5 domain-containing protein n=1 Tax=Nocardioides nanhaiensis TaxID=1476871 RepID=A0ABP8VRY3_9ACTN
MTHPHDDVREHAADHGRRGPLRAAVRLALAATLVAALGALVLGVPGGERGHHRGVETGAAPGAALKGLPRLTSRTYPWPGAAPAPQPPAAPARGATDIGFSPGFDILYQPEAELHRDLAAMRALGMRRLRVDLSWAFVERQRGRYDWSANDRVFGAARAAGLQVLAVVGYAPSWATSSAGTPDAAGFADFVSAAARRYGPTVAAWEIWNEPNLERFWDAPDPEGYARLVAAAAPRLAALDPAAAVVVGSLAPAVDARDGSQISPETFLRRFYAALPRPLPRGLFDAVSVHPYSYPALPAGDEEWNTFARLPEIREVMVQAGDSRSRVWLTEYGAPTGTSDRAVSTGLQSRMLVEAVREARRLPFVSALYLYSYRDAGSSPGDPEANFGVVRADGGAKPALAALRRALR